MIYKHLILIRLTDNPGRIR